MRYPFIFLYVLLITVFVSCKHPQKTENLQSKEESIPTVELKLDSLNQVIAKDSTDSEGYFLRSKYYLQEGQANNALADINKAIQLNDKKAGYFVTLADIYLAINKVPNCMEALLKALEMDPGNNDALLKLSEVYLILKDYDNCFKYSGMALDKERINPVAHFIRGYAYMEIGDTALAIKNFQAAADQDQKYYEAYVQLGILYSIAKNPLATGYLQTATRISPNRTEAYYLLGLAYQDQENFIQAIATYNQLLVLDPGYKEALYNIAYINLVHTGDYKTATEYFTRAITIDPEYIDAYFNRGYSFELLGDYARARQDYELSLKIVPNYERSIEGLNRLDKLEMP
jgi:tetratricopeptide (TPR) repeat protein